MKIVISTLIILGAFIVALATFSAELSEQNKFLTLETMTVHPGNINPDTELVIIGKASKARLPIFVKIETQNNRTYQTRYDAERWVKDGDFSLTFPLYGLSQNNGTKMPSNEALIVTVFTFEKYAPLLQAQITVRSGTAFQFPYQALDFGPENAPVFPGFEGVYPKDDRLVCDRKCNGIERSYHDKLIGDGVAGVTKINLTASPGRYSLYLWLEDTGEWEYVPHFLERRIKVNGKIVHYENNDPRQWLRQNYESPADPAHKGELSHWNALGVKRGGLFKFDVNVKGSQLQIEFAGDRKSATHVAALLLEPKDRVSLLPDIHRKQERRGNTRWPVFEVKSSVKKHIQPLEQVNFLPQDGVIYRRFDIPEAVIVNVEVPADKDGQLDARIWRSIRKVTRPYANAEFLVNDTRRLVPLDIGVPFSVPEIVLELKSTNAQGADIYKGKVLWERNGYLASTPLNVNAVSIDRPEATYPIAAYVELAPPELWFPGAVDPVHKCVSKILQQFGLNSTSLPFNPHLLSKKDDLITSLIEGNEEESFAYAHLKSFLNHYGWTRTEELLHLVELKAKKKGKQIIWSLADEPHKSDIPKLRQSAKRLKDKIPNIQLAGHLNHPSLAQVADIFDVLILNEGFGSMEDIHRFTENRSSNFWYYNFKNPRFGAGLFSSLSNGNGYLHWHSFMPTANPHDPTDGREGDMFLVYPEPSPCRASPAIDLDLILLAQAVDDAKWVGWIRDHHPDDINGLIQFLVINHSLSPNFYDQWLHEWRSVVQAAIERHQ